MAPNDPWHQRDLSLSTLWQITSTTELVEVYTGVGGAQLSRVLKANSLIRSSPR